MNPITVFLTIACLAVGVALGATGYLYPGVAIVEYSILRKIAFGKSDELNEGASV